MTPKPLNRPFVGISIAKDDYGKVAGLLPTPTYKDRRYSHDSEWIHFVYVVDTFHGSSKEYKQLSDIKLGMAKTIFVPVGFLDFFYIHDDTEVNPITYTLTELSRAFRCEYLIYPKILFPHSKKELYRHLTLHGKKLRYKKVFTLEAMTAAALMMNRYLPDKMLDKEVHKKALAAYRYIIENPDNFKEKLSRTQRKEAYAKGAIMTNAKQSHKTKAKIAELLKDDTYIKPNGKPNKTALAKALKLHRKTLDKYL